MDWHTRPRGDNAVKIGPWGILAALFFARLGMGYQFQLVASTAPQLQQSFALTYTDIGGLIGLYMLPGLVLAMPSGFLGARLGERRLVAVGLAVMALGTAWCALASDITLISAARVLSGFGAILMNVLMTKLIMDWFTKGGMVLAMAIFVSSWPAGVALALLVQAPLSVGYGWPAAFWSGAALAGAGLLAFLLVHRPAPGAAAIVAKQWPNRREVPGLVCIAACWALFNIGYALMFGFAPVFLAGQGASVIAANGWIGMVMCIGTLSTALGGAFIQRLDGGRYSVPAILLLFAATLLILAYVNSSIWLLVIMAILGPAPAGGIMALPSRVLSPPSRTLGMALFFTIFYIGMAAGPAAAGWAIDWTGDKAAALILGAATCVLAAGLFAVTWKMSAARA